MWINGHFDYNSRSGFSTARNLRVSKRFQTKPNRKSDKVNGLMVSEMKNFPTGLGRIQQPYILFRIVSSIFIDFIAFILLKFLKSHTHQYIICIQSRLIYKMELSGLGSRLWNVYSFRYTSKKWLLLKYFFQMYRHANP